jgi:hypothetical protein
MEWQKPITKERNEVLSWLAAARSGAAHLKEQAARRRWRASETNGSPASKLGPSDGGKAASGDVLRGTGGGDVICGLGGDDVAIAGDGADVVFGDAGRDRVQGGAGDDTLYGGEGDDVLVGGSDWDVLSGGPGNDDLAGGPGGRPPRGRHGNQQLRLRVVGRHRERLRPVSREATRSAGPPAGGSSVS